MTFGADRQGELSDCLIQILGGALDVASAQMIRALPDVLQDCEAALNGLYASFKWFFREVTSPTSLGTLLPQEDGIP